MKEKDYIRDLAEIRSMMERTSKFLSLSGWAGIMAGVYALIGTYLARQHFDLAGMLYPDTIPENQPASLLYLVTIALIVLVFAIGTAVFLSHKKAHRRHEKIWNGTSRRMLAGMAVPLVSGGLLALVLLSQGSIRVIPGITLLFYGIALYNAGYFTYREVRMLGLMEMTLGLISVYFIGYGLLLWAIGFGVLHIVYGIYIHYKYER